MLSFLNKYAKNYMFSQNGEEAIIEEVWRRMSNADHSMLHLMPKGHAVEVGAHDGFYCSNTARLLMSGWTGLLIEADWDRYLQCKTNWQNNDPKPRVQCSRVDQQNVNAFVDDGCDLLSIDTDGNDYEIFKGLQARPKVVIVEIDSSIEPPSERVNADGGVGYWTMTTLALESGYFLLVHTGNLVLVHQRYQHLFPECKPHPLLEWELYFNRAWVKEGA